MNGNRKLKRARFLFYMLVAAIVLFALIKAISGKEGFAGLVIAASIGLAGLFQNSIKSYLYRPVLKTVYQSGIPYGHKVTTRTPTGGLLFDNYYFRIKIENTGNETMKDIEIVAEECQKEISPGKYERVQDFLPLNLSWAHRYNLRTMPFIRDGFYWFCSFGYIRKTEFAGLDRFDRFMQGSISRAVCTLDTIPQPNSGEHILVPGDYKISLVITAANLKPERRLVRLHLENEWDENRDSMFLRNVLSINENADLNL